MTATINTRDRDGSVLAQAVSTNSVYETDIYSGQWAKASALVQQLVAENVQALTNTVEAEMAHE